jgi:tRNA uridine 5-carboxymethylaminomethyl modification enzyme
VLVAASDAVNAILLGCGSTPIAHPARAFELLKRPEVSYAAVLAMAGLTQDLTQALDTDEAAQLEIDVKYEGYVRRQAEMVDRFKRLEDAVIPQWVDYAAVSGLSTEVRERLLSVRPRSLGQAARMPGMTPAAISLLAFHLKSRRDRNSDATRDS